MSSTLPDTSSSGDAPLVCIPSVTVSQLIGSAPPKPLATGELRLLPAPAAAAAEGEPHQSPSAKEVLLLLQVGEEHVFPLQRGTTMGTHEGHEEWYTFDLDLDLGEGAGEGSGEQAQARTWIRLVLPPLSQAAPLVALRDRFEGVLIARGLLLDGVRAAGDELGQAASQGGRQTAKKWREAAEEYRATVEPAGSGAGPSAATGTGTATATGSTAGTGFSQWSHAVADGAAGGSATLAHYTGQASAAVSGLASSAGSALGGAYARARESMVGSDGEREKGEQEEGKVYVYSEEEKGDGRVMPNMRDAMYDAFEGAREGASSLYSTTTSEGPLLASHAGGPDAGKLTSQAGQTAGNVAQAGLDVTVGTSTVAHGVQAAKGAVEAQPQREGGA